jgi:hypothetical protein
MQLIVSVYRFLIALFFVLALGLAAFVITSGMSRGSGLGILGMAGGLTMFMMVVIAIGATATFISIHDRLCEMVAILNQTRRSAGQDEG